MREQYAEEMDEKYFRQMHILDTTQAVKVAQSDISIEERTVVRRARRRAQLELAMAAARHGAELAAADAEIASLRASVAQKKLTAVKLSQEQPNTV